jgi:polar amino acid transport system substrate-binding protein
MLKSILVLFFCLIISNVFADNTVIFAFNERIPVVYKDNPTRPYKGLYVDILKEIFEKRMGMKLIFHYRPWKRAQMEVKEGISDIMVTVATNKRLTYTIKTKYSILTFFIRIYTYKGNEKINYINSIKSVNDIKKFKLTPVSYRGNGWHKKNIDGKGIKTYYVGDLAQAVVFLANHRADLLIASEIFVNYLIKLKHLSHKLQATKAKFGPIKMHLLISKKSKLAKRIDRINDILKELEESGYIDNVARKYIN